MGRGILFGIVSVLAIIGLISIAQGKGSFSSKGKYAVILQAGKNSQDGMARAVHAFLYAQELKEHGHQVVVIFDGAGTEWIEELTNPDSTSKVKPAYDKFRQTGVQQIICDYCAGAFKVKGPLKIRDLPLTGDYSGHPSIAKYVNQGYELIVL